MAGSDFSAPCITGYGSSPSRCGPATAARRSGQTRDLPGSDTIPLHVMWPLTPAGRQHLAERCRTCCLRANENPRPLRCLIFRGSIPHPMQSLCTLRNRCRQRPRNTRYQADATPYLGRTSTGWIAPALPGALIQSPRRHGRAMAAALVTKLKTAAKKAKLDAADSAAAVKEANNRAAKLDALAKKARREATGREAAAERARLAAAEKARREAAQQAKREAAEKARLDAIERAKR